MYNASIHVQRPDGTFTPNEQDAAKAIVVEICRAAGFRETDTPDALSDHPSSSYRWFVSLGGKDFEQDSVGISGGMRKDRREIRIVLEDERRGEPLPSTRKMIDDLRVALERAFPDSHVEVTTKKIPRVFGP
jgi:hypothetical protein